MKDFKISLFRAFALLLLPLIIGLSSSAAAASVNVFPQCTAGNAANGTDVCQSVNSSKANTNPFISFIKIAITVLSVVIGFAAVIVIILSGLKFITAGGDPQAVANARSSILYALVGLVVAILAESIVLFVLDKL